VSELSEELKADIKTRLAVVKQQFRTLDRMAEHLQAFPGFEKVNKSTISRWLLHPTDRTLVALRLLAGTATMSQGTGKRLLIAVPDSILAIPLIMVAAPRRREEWKNISFLEQHFGIPTECRIVKDGGEAVRQLIEGKVHIAFAAQDIINESRETETVTSCTSLCSIAETPLLAIGADLRYSKAVTRVGYMAGTAVGERLQLVINHHGWPPAKLVPVRSIEDAAQRFITSDKKQIDAFVGWDTSVISLAMMLRNQDEPNPSNRYPTHRILSSSTLAKLQTEVAVNLRSIEPSHVRAFLAALNRVIRDQIEPRRDQALFHGEIEADFGINQDIAAEGLKYSEFHKIQVSVETILQFWNAECGNSDPKWN